ncbi:MAG TPA: hypothetical protein VHY19_09235 [Steroidobacteraceae bacterium]|jgi:hypothetical protein|nr:hypothetical protein [Steroidobacteraceae bacterium]
MSNRALMGLGGQAVARSRGAWGFTAGVLVGLTGAIAGLTLAVAAQRRTRRQSVAAGSGAPSDGAQDSDEQRAEQAEQNQLDEELAQTFPASDPLPQSHRVD